MPRGPPKSAETVRPSRSKVPSLFSSNPLTEFDYVVTDFGLDDQFVKTVRTNKGVKRAANMFKRSLSPSPTQLEGDGDTSPASKSPPQSQQQSQQQQQQSLNVRNGATAMENGTTTGGTPQQQAEQRRIRFAEKERPRSAAAGRTRPGRSVLKTPSRRRLQGRPSSAASRRKIPTTSTSASPLDDGDTPNVRLAPHHQATAAEVKEMLDIIDDSNLNEELTTDVVGMLSPVQRQRYYSRPALSSRMRMSDYQVHRLNHAHPLRLTEAPRWDTSCNPIAPNDFHADRTKSLGAHRPRARSSSLRRYHTGKAIANYSTVVGKPTLPMSEMNKPWNRVTQPAYFSSATNAVLGERKQYGYGARVEPHGGYDIGRTLSYSDALGVFFDRDEDAKVVEKDKVVAKQQRQKRQASREQLHRAGGRGGGDGKGGREGKTREKKERQRGGGGHKSSGEARQRDMSKSVISKRITHRPKGLMSNIQSGFRVTQEKVDRVIVSEEYKAKARARRRRKVERNAGR